MGAVMPVWRSAPVKVVVCQCPCGTGAWQRSPYRRAAAQARHLRRGAGFIEKDESLRIEIGLGVEPGLALKPHVGTLLLAGVRGFF